MTNNSDLRIQANVWRDADMTFAAHAALNHVPLAGTFELTPRCTLRCKMCYIRLDPADMKAIGRELTAEEWIHLGKDAADAGTVNLLITGGEPMLRPDFPEIYSALCQMGFIMTINTNATLITDEIVHLFSKFPPTEVDVTLYGASPETYEKICGDGSGFDRTIRGLEALAKLPTQLEVRTTFIQDNMTELRQLRSIANRYTKRYAINTEVFKAIRGATADVESCRLSPAQMQSVTIENQRYYEQLNQGGKDDNASSDMTNGSDKDNGFGLRPTILQCLAAKSMYWITWDGKMLPCGTFSSPYTLPLEEGFKAAWDRLPDLLEDILPPAECLTCEYMNGSCPNCPAILQSETGSFCKPASYSCEIARYRNRK